MYLKITSENFSTNPFNKIKSFWYLLILYSRTINTTFILATYAKWDVHIAD